MDNKDSFEDFIKAKIDALEQTPPDKLGVQLKQKLNAQKKSNFPWSSIIPWAIVCLLLLAFLIFQYTGNRSPKKNISSPKKFPQAIQLDSKKLHKEHNHGHQAHIIDSSQKKDKFLVIQTPDDIKNKPYIKARLQAQAEQKLIFIHAFNLDCNHCQKMRDITLANPEVKTFLREYFVKIDINLQLIENKDVAMFYDIKTSPKFLFLNKKGQLVSIANGFQEPAKFIQILENAMEEEAAGSYIDLMSKKRINPMPGKLQKVGTLKNDLLSKGIQLLTVKVFPNPTRGKFTTAIKGQKSPLQIRIIDLNGKVIVEQTKTKFNGAEKLDFDLTGQLGHYIIQFSQGKSMIYKKVVVQ